MSSVAHHESNLYPRRDLIAHGAALKKYLSLLSPALVALCSAASAGTQQITIVPLNDSARSGALSSVYIDGSISPGITQRLVSALEAQKVVGGVVYFNSNGGDLEEALKLGKFIRQAGFDAGIGSVNSGGGKPAPASCESACIMSLAGGVYRFASERSFIGIHRFYSKQAGVLDLELGQVVSSAIISHLLEMGVSPSLFELMVNAGNIMQKLQLTDALRVGLINNGYEPAQWKIQGEAGRVFLEGSLNTWTGSGKLHISCSRGEPIKLDAFFNSRDFNAARKGVGSIPMLSVDGRAMSLQKVNTTGSIPHGAAAASVRLSDAVIHDIRSARNLGFGWNFPNPDISFGFTIPAFNDRSLIDSFFTHCTS